MGIFSTLSHRSRLAKIARFFTLMAPEQSDLTLELGASGKHSQTQMLEQYPWPGRVVAANLYFTELRLLVEKHPEVRAVMCDASALPFRDDAFDIVYSNAVIEHLPTPDAQERMAREIMRCGKRWFVTTPNKWFPFEFHARLPFVSWFSGTRAFRAVVRIFSWDHMRNHYRFRPCSDPDVRLLSARKLKRLLPPSNITKLRISIWPETLIASGSKKGMPVA